MFAQLSGEQISALVHQVFPNVSVLSRDVPSSKHIDLSYHLKLSNLMDTTLKVYSDASAADREIHLLRMLTNETGVPVPRVLFFAERLPDEIGLDDLARSWALLARLPGHPLSEVIDTLDDWESESVGYEMGRYVGHIHQIPLDEFGPLFGSGPHNHQREKGYVLSQATEWLEACARDELLPAAVLDRLQHYFAGTDLLQRRRACLIHGDLSPADIIVERGATGYHVTGILDLTHAMGGSPELDMGKLLAWYIQDSPSLQKGFLDGYTEAGELGAKFWQRLVLYQAFASLEALLDAHQCGLIDQAQAYKDLLSRYVDELAQQATWQL
jgi:aminoglycoside phosphotransferase (APT) family kinase protein